MFFYIFLYYSCFIFTYNSAIHYNGIIQLNIKPNPFVIKKDLNIVEQYKKDAGLINGLGAPIITSLNDNLQKNGLGLYEPNKNSYQELHYEVAKKLLETNMKGVAGIPAHYRGYSTLSDNNGNIFFPRLDDTNIISIVITKNIHPVIIHGSVPDHFIVDHSATYASYRAENIEKNKSSSVMKWTVSPDTSLIINQKIPYPTIIIIADPDLFFFDNNPHSMDSSINILLPTLYVLEESAISHYSNLAMQTLQYFKQLNTAHYSTEIENQLHEGIVLK